MYIKGFTRDYLLIWLRRVLLSNTSLYGYLLQRRSMSYHDMSEVSQHQFRLPKYSSYHEAVETEELEDCDQEGLG